MTFNELIRRSDELWVFGPISDGVKCEVELAKSLNRTIKYFEIDSETNEIRETKCGRNEE